MTVWYLPSANIILFIIETAFRFGILREKPLQCVSGEAEPGNFLRTILPNVRFLSVRSGKQTAPDTFKCSAL